MRIAVVGSRDWPDASVVYDYVNKLESSATVVSGGARGVDIWAIRTAKQRKMAYIECGAGWVAGKGAGYARNTVVVELSDKIVAFWDGKSRGTLDTINKAKAAGKPVEIIL